VAPAQAARGAEDDDLAPRRHGRDLRRARPQARAGRRGGRDVPLNRQQKHRQAGKIGAQGRQERQPQALGVQRDAH